ncbi:MAG: class I SAM-dependent methyltransferase [Chloroflexi bacterium]|nr:class I SAM-dependent methyltransferase [Chloroflexota bacterium]
MSFSPIARFYDLDDGRLTDDIPLYLGFAGKSKGPILDLGVGSARLATPIAEQGRRVVGLDIAGEMLSIGRERIAAARLNDRIELIQADFRQPPLADEQFGLAYCGYNAFLHLIEGHDQMQALTAWRRLLRSGGLLVMDVENPQLEALSKFSEVLELEESFIEPDTGAPILKFAGVEVNLPDQVMIIRRLYQRLTENGAWERFETEFQFRILFQRELALLLSCAGYVNLRFYGDYEMNPWEPHSPRLISVCEKP